MTAPVLVATCPHKLVGIVEFKGDIIIATEHGVWRLDPKTDVLSPILFEEEPSDG